MKRKKGIEAFTSTARSRARGKRRGVVATYVALSVVVLLGAAGLAIDSSHLYLTRAKAQRAADAAALAGAIKMMSGATKAEADAVAQQVAAANGYDVAKGATFVSVYPAPGGSNWYRVTVSRNESLYFMPVLGIRSQLVAAPATAAFEQAVNIDATGGSNTYGAQGRMNLSVYGPYAAKQHGDAYSPKFLDDVSAAYIPGAKSGDPNPDYTPTGYDFFVHVPANYASLNGNSTQVSVEVFDPDTYNNGGTDANGIERVDELRPSPHGSYPLETTTEFSLYYTNGTPDTSDDVLIGKQSYKDDSATDMKWVQPNNFSFDLTDSRWQSNAFNSDSFRLNVRSTDGSSENGFLLRAGPPRAADAAFNPANGTSITAQGRIPINFNQDGIVEVNLGFVPPNSVSFYIDKFDTDVGAKSVTYTDGVYTFNGELSANGQHKRDTYTLPSNYGGGNWRATYTAGRQDTSSWSMYYTGPSNGSPGSVRLVR